MSPHHTTTITTYCLLCLAGAGSFVLPDSAGPPVELAAPVSPPITTIDEMIRCGVGADANQLLRCTFRDDSFVGGGTLSLPGGTSIEGVESIGWTPAGPNPGLCGFPEFVFITEQRDPLNTVQVASFD